jgi:hypothetical protein
MKQWKYNILDALRLTDFWATQRLRNRLKTESDECRKYKMLSRFLFHTAKHMSLEYFGGEFPGSSDHDKLEFKTWENVDSGLNYFSDRWSLSRILRLHAFIDFHNWQKITRSDD